MATSVLGLLNGVTDQDDLPAGDWNLLADTLEQATVQLCELLGSGVFLAADFNLTAIPGALSVQVSAGSAIVGDGDAKRVVQNTSAATVSGLAPSTTNYIYVRRDGTFVTNTTGTPPANTLLVGSCVTDGTEATSVNSNPTGRVNLGGVGFLGATQTWTGQNTFSNGTAPIIAAKLGPSSSQQHALPAVASDTIALLAAAQTLSGKTIGAATFSGNLTLNDAINIVLGATTGTKLGTATTQKIGVWNATPVARPSAYTQTYATADKTLASYTPDAESGAYSGIDNTQGGTPYAQLTDLNSLRAAYENLRALAEDTAQMLNAVVDDFQLIGWLA